MRGQHFALLGLAVLASWLVNFGAYASFGDEGPGVGLAAQLLCQTFTIMSGPVGLFIGFAVALYGLWQMVVDGDFKGGLLFIVVGALLTALPGVTRTFLAGANELLRAAGVSTESITDPMNYALNQQGNCSAIPVDWSRYDSSQAGFFASPGVGPDGKPLPSPFASGRPDAANAVRGGRAAGGNVRPEDASGPAKPPGCAQLVQGGTLGNRGFGMQMHPIEKRWKMHTGTDIRCASGAQITHNGGGRIIRADWAGGYGRRVEVDVGGGLVKTYSHLSGFGPGVSQGASAPSLIGYCGTTGSSTGNHLHFEHRLNGTWVDPVSNGC
jgi:murein DD-endopeptidase MepM/ murein hydrolase activator NlpD